MKKLIYLAILALIVAMVVLKGFREKVFRSVLVAKSGVERLFIRGDHLEIRFVNEGGFDRVKNEPGRLVIIRFQHEFTSVAKTQSAAFDAKMKHLPAKVLLAKVPKEQNESLLESEGVDVLPTLRVYREGKLIRQYEAPIDTDAFVEEIEYLLEHWEE